MGSVHLVGARRPGLSTGGARVSWSVHWAGRVPGLAPGHADRSLGVSWVQARRVARVCLQAHSISGVPFSPRTRRGATAACGKGCPGPQVPTRWWLWSVLSESWPLVGVGSGGPEHSGGEGESGEQAAAWKKRLVTGAGGWVSGRGASGCKVAGLSRVGCLIVFRGRRKHLILSKNPL